MNSSTKKNPIIKRVIQIRIKYFGKRGKSDFARKLGISPSTYSYYEQDRVPPADILLKMSKAVDVRLEWLIAGENIFADASNNSTSQANSNISSGTSDIARAVEALVMENPKLERAISAFIEIICEKNNIKNPLGSGDISAEKKRSVAEIVQKPASSKADGKELQRQPEILNGEGYNQLGNVAAEGMIPVLGRTAAGIVHCWDQCDGPDSWHAETKLSELVKKYIGKDIVCSRGGEVEIDSDTAKLAGRLVGRFNTEAYIVQVRGDNEGVVEFVDCCDMAKKYPDCFALRVDGDSMRPTICDGDIVILSPSVPAKQGSVAVAKVRDQIGVTCKIIRFDGEMVHLVAGNEKYETRIVEREQLIWALAVLGHIKRR